MRLLTAAIISAATLLLAGCPNPNAIGVQTTGTVQVTTVDQNGNPVSGARVSAGSNYTCNTGANGICTSVLTLPVGPWTINAYAPGLTGTVTNVMVTENQQTSVTITMNPTG
ncbi:MAG TPA: carboxypeptidase-like regulatory domain-containing protein [Candidatus Eremiobacteraceae bacterium]|nr:carboxypeptidase-like regulatory domain-containing protein [Candidatus Eremiobacteraceae bacterium]